MLTHRKEHKIILIELLKRLDNGCSNSESTCPMFISDDLSIEPEVWVGNTCMYYFADLYSREPNIDEFGTIPFECNYECPCYEILYIKLEKRIKELINYL